MNSNDIRNSLVAGLPTPRRGSVDKTETTNAKSGNELPQAATSDRKDPPKEPERAEVLAVLTAWLDARH